MKTRSKRGTFKRGTPKLQPATAQSVLRPPSPTLPPPAPTTLANQDETRPKTKEKGPCPEPKSERQLPSRQVQPTARPNSSAVHSPASVGVPHSSGAEGSQAEEKPKPETQNPKLKLESAIAAWRSSQTELSDLDKLLAEKSARQATLETTGDLSDPAVLAEVGALQILTNLLPRRITAKKQAEIDAENAVIHTTNQFIREHLAPRVRDLAARTRTTVEAELSPHFRDPAALIRAVAGSERVQRTGALLWPTTITPSRGTMEHAQGALKAWSDVDKFENQLGRNIG